MPQFRLVESAAEAAQACAQLGYPAVMKVVSPEILHKSDLGGGRGRYSERSGSEPGVRQD